MQSVCIMCTYWLNLASYLNTKWIVVKSLVTEPICYSIWFMALIILVFHGLFHFAFVLYSMGHVSFPIICCHRVLTVDEMAETKECICGANRLENLKALSTFVQTEFAQKRRWKNKIKSTGEGKQAWGVRKERNTQTLNKELKMQLNKTW